jgi:hypothetical protein
VSVASAITAAAMMRHVRELSEQYPHRHTGEPDERGAAGYIADQFELSGLSVRTHELSVMGWELTAEPRLELLAPDQLELECVPFIFSGSTAADGVQGELRYVGPTDVVGIAPSWEKFAIFDAADQPRAFVVGRPSGPAIAQSGPPAGYAGTQDGPHYTWPAATVGSDDLARLQAYRSQARAVEVRLSVNARHKPAETSFIVQADLPGVGREPRGLVMIGAHHDCMGAIGFPAAADSPGACDNASGVGAVLELARYYREQSHPCDLRFLTYGGEEWNLTGSRHYVRSLRESGELSQVIGKINLDQSANGARLRVQASGADCAVTPRYDMAALARAQIDELDVEAEHEVEWRVPPQPGSDHWPYYVAGVPTYYALWDPIPNYHRGGDTADACTRDDKYELTATLARGMIDRLGELHAT